MNPINPSGARLRAVALSLACAWAVSAASALAPVAGLAAEPDPAAEPALAVEPASAALPWATEIETPAASAFPAPPPAPDAATRAMSPPPASDPTAAGRSTLADRARFLAGLPVSPGSPLEALEARPEWKDHEAAMARAWPLLAGRLERAEAFEASSLAPLIQRDRKVIYFFGGPDAAHVVKLFPDAPAYLLAGLEPVGAVEAPEAMRFEEVHAAIDGLAVALKTIIEKSFFRTSDMGRDLRGKGIRGVEPVLMIFLARSGAEVLEATSFVIDSAGQAHDRGAHERMGPGVPGVRLRFRFPGRPAQELSYVSVDLLDDKLAAEPGFLTWARRFAPANGMLKAASFILHDRAFSRSRAFLLDACQAILQDDSGVPYRAYRKAGDWELTCFGPYQRPRDPFQGHLQPDLAEACGSQPRRPLDFIIGYRRLNDTALQLYARRSPTGQASLASGVAPFPASGLVEPPPTSTAQAAAGPACLDEDPPATLAR
jgi:hypothetical protein